MYIRNVHHDDPYLTGSYGSYVQNVHCNDMEFSPYNILNYIIAWHGQSFVFETMTQS